MALISASKQLPVRSYECVKKNMHASVIPFYIIITSIFYTEESDVNSAISTINDWFELGLQLKISYHILEAILIDFEKYGVRRQRSKLVHSWLQRDPAASWSKLCGALERMGENTAAQDIRTKHMAGGLYSCVWNPVLRGLNNELRGSL